MDKSLAVGLHVALKTLPFEKYLTEMVGIQSPLYDFQSKPLFYNLFGEKRFVSACRVAFPNISQSEAENIYNNLTTMCNSFENDNLGLFSIIKIFAKNHLKINGLELKCRHDKFILWRETIHGIGQLPFICAFAAASDVANPKHHDAKSRDFENFPIYVRSDDYTLRQILSKGTAENHYHLIGSSPAFLNNWVCLMNNITHRKEDFTKLEPLLNRSFNTLHKYTLYEYIRMAAGLRIYLWRILNNKNNGNNNDKSFCDTEYFDSTFYKWHKYIQSERTSIYIEQERKMSEKDRTLDYICNTKGYENVYSGIMGECIFLYRCFYALYSGDNKKILAAGDCFYAYLAIWSLLRSELTQDNYAAGFDNFKNYQDRKDVFILENTKYEDSFVNMALHTPLTTVGIRSVEI